MQDNPRLGIAMMIATTIVFAVQDGISRYLAENYNVITVVMIRYMFFMCFVDLVDEDVVRVKHVVFGFFNLLRLFRVF